MSIQTFKLSRQFSPDLRTNFPDDFGGKDPVLGFTYCEGSYWIRICEGSFHTVMGNTESESESLDVLEKMLFDYTGVL